MKYRPKCRPTDIVEAWCWSGLALSSVTPSWVNEHPVRVRVEYPDVVYAGAWDWLEKGDYLVRYHDGRVRVIRGKDFESQYEII